MLRHTYKPKVKALPTFADYRAEQEGYQHMLREVERIKTEHATRLKAIRKELLAKKAWLLRYERLMVHVGSEVELAGATTDLLPLTAAEQAAMDVSMKNVFG